MPLEQWLPAEALLGLEMSFHVFSNSRQNTERKGGSLCLFEQEWSDNLLFLTQRRP